MTEYPAFAEARGTVDAPPVVVFDFLDDQANLSAHMSRSSGMMLGSSMTIRMEPDHTRRVGSAFGFTGSIFGIPLAVDEVVTGRVPPREKTWETTAEPQLWVIGRYQMGFELAPEGQRSSLTVHIRYALPARGFQRLPGRMLGRTYAKWCTRQMVSDAQKHFSRQPGHLPTPAPL
ncbi:MAG: SRPBCC family protein [Devosia nanyangense]|uniref:SRPBCC family protein n=1 Tax=Devosia nanyangense TaxID=1228055 RepID=A0A933L4F3_9HYPH|nr:SRPBCC family protein [Devosia nanyangense]